MAEQRFGILLWWVIVIGVPGLSACTGLKTFPQAARSGDTVALALGSADGMSRANTTAAFVSSVEPGVPYDLTGGIRGIFKLYGDKASSLYAPGSTTGHIVTSSGHEAWLTVMVVDLPQDLPVGPGEVRITTTASYPTIGSHINDKPVGLEILPGQGAASNLAYEFGVGASMPGDLSLLEALPHAQVIPPYNADWPPYGAIEMKLHVPTSEGTGVRVVADELRVSISSNLSVLSQRDSNQELVVMLMRGDTLRHYEARFSIVLIDLEGTGSFLATPSILSVRYFDTEGNQVAGPGIADFVVEQR